MLNIPAASRGAAGITKEKIMRHKYINIALIVIITIIKGYSAELLYTLEEPNILGYTKFGDNVAYAGDVNGDHKSDYLVYGTRTHTVFLQYYNDNAESVQLKLKGASSIKGKRVSYGSGDLNGDGFDDILTTDTDNSKAYIYFGSSNPDPEIDLELSIGGVTPYRPGITSAIVGDLNNDSYDDIAVGSQSYDNWKGIVHIFYGGLDMDTTADVILNYNDIDQPNPYFGYTVEGIGDFNNDGYDDFATSAYLYNSAAGRVYVYFGGPNMDNTVDLILDGEHPGDHFGITISGGSDLNNDGIDDMVINAGQYNGFLGRVYVYFGNNEADTIADVIYTGENFGDEFGYQLSTKGDLNGDNICDLVIGAPGYPGYGTSYQLYYYFRTGKTYIYYGGTEMDDSPSTSFSSDTLGCITSFDSNGDINNDGISDLLTGIPNYLVEKGRICIYNGSTDFDWQPDNYITGPGTENRFGVTVSVMDINNDQKNELIVGSAYNNSGRLYIYNEQDSKNQTPVTIDYPEKEAWFKHVGYGFINLNDINNDQLLDFAIVKNRTIYFYLGSDTLSKVPDYSITMDWGYAISDVFSVGDMNNDGNSDFCVRLKMGWDKSKFRIYWGNQDVNSITYFEFPTIYNDYVNFSGINDFNGDGRDDIAVSIQEPHGALGIYWGKETLLSEPDILLGSDENFGTDVYARVLHGDFNRDGYEDLIIYRNHHWGTTYIHFGGPEFSTQPDYELTGWENERYNLTTIIDLNQDNYDDIVFNKYPDNKYYVMYGNSNSQFNLESCPALNDSPWSLITDMDQDGDLELVYGAPGEGDNGKVHVYSLFDSASGITDNKQPSDITLYYNYPNPFNAGTTIRFYLTNPHMVNLTIYDRLGRQVANPVRKKYNKGLHYINWNAGSLPSGIYFYKITAGDFTKTGKMALIK